MRRICYLAMTVLVAASLLTGCAKPKVTVLTGERVYCTYGELQTNNVRSIKVPADEAKRYSVKRRTILCEKHRKLGEMYEVAQDALEKGDLKAAEKALATLVAQDRTFRRAAEQLEQVRKGKRPSPDNESATPNGDSTPTSNKPGDSNKPKPKPEGPATSMSGYVPDTIDGFTAQAVLVEDFSLTRQYDATDKSKFLALAVVAQQYRDKSAASVAQARHKQSYSRDGQNVTVAGKTVYVGTNGRGLAGLVYRSGSVVVVYELAAAKDGDSIIDELRRIGSEVLK